MIERNRKNMLEKKYPVLFSRKEECCGCTACFAVCSKKAIEMIEDEEGFLYPNVDNELCVKCYVCLSVCPMKDKN